MAAPVIHHVGVGVTGETVSTMLSMFQDKLGFQIVGQRRSYFDEKWVLQHGAVIFVLTKVIGNLTGPGNGYTDADARPSAYTNTKSDSDSKSCSNTCSNSRGDSHTQIDSETDSPSNAYSYTDSHGDDVIHIHIDNHNHDDSKCNTNSNSNSKSNGNPSLEPTDSHGGTRIATCARKSGKIQCDDKSNSCSTYTHTDTDNPSLTLNNGDRSCGESVKGKSYSGYGSQGEGEQDESPIQIDACYEAENQHAGQGDHSQYQFRSQAKNHHYVHHLHDGGQRTAGESESSIVTSSTSDMQTGKQTNSLSECLDFNNPDPYLWDTSANGDNKLRVISSNIKTIENMKNLNSQSGKTDSRNPIARYQTDSLSYSDNIYESLGLPHFSSFWHFTENMGTFPSSHGVESSKNSCKNVLGENQVCNSVYEICLEVQDVSKTLKKAQECGAIILRPLTTVRDVNGVVTYATIKSCIGNVQHTVVNTSEYHGEFLPGFEIQAPAIMSSPPLKLNDIDHIALCVYPGQTSKTISWYERCFGMHRLLVNKDEDPVEGLSLNEIGMRLAAMEYWRCAETGLSIGPGEKSAKFVVVESSFNSPNQVTTFLEQHGGAGVQHIGILTDQLTDAVSYLQTTGLPFLQPPSEYYREINKFTEISDCGESVEMLEACGILLDSEADAEAESGDAEPMSRYLMQIFTKPIFGNNTFFFEFLQRHGALGFGAGNITALWKAVKLYMERKKDIN